MFEPNPVLQVKGLGHRELSPLCKGPATNSWPLPWSQWDTLSFSEGEMGSKMIVRSSQVGEEILCSNRTFNFTVTGSYSLEQGDSHVFMWWRTLLRAHFLWRTGTLPFFLGREEKKDFSRERRWERVEAVLGNSAHSYLDGLLVIKTRCANVSRPLHVETAQWSRQGGVAPGRPPPRVGTCCPWAQVGEVLRQAMHWLFSRPSFLLVLWPSTHSNMEANRLSSAFPSLPVFSSCSGRASAGFKSVCPQFLLCALWWAFIYFIYWVSEELFT